MDYAPRHSSECGELPIDFTKRFIAPQLTPLFHTRVYETLSKAVQLRYNQLHAFYFNEQVSFFEQAMLSPALLALQKSVPPPRLAEGLRAFFEEEQQHTARFRALNLRCAPEFYSAGPHYFIQIPRTLAAILRALAARPHLFPLLLWLALMQEERSLFYSKTCLGHAVDLEPRFVAMHRWHLADEIGHVAWDEDLLDWLWPQIGRTARVTNVRILNWMIGEFFFLPKRSGLRVVRQLVQEYPHLDATALDKGMADLRNDDTYLQTLYSREITPRSFARFDALPEFALLAKTLPGYSFPGSAA